MVPGGADGGAADRVQPGFQAQHAVAVGGVDAQPGVAVGEGAALPISEYLVVVAGVPVVQTPAQPAPVLAAGVFGDQRVQPGAGRLAASAAAAARSAGSPAPAVSASSAGSSASAAPSAAVAWALRCRSSNARAATCACPTPMWPSASLAAVAGNSANAAAVAAAVLASQRVIPNRDAAQSAVDTALPR